MIEDDPRPRAGRLPLGLLGALVLIAAVERQVARHKLATFAGSHWGYEIARRAADSGAKDCDVLCFGDSLMKQGMAPTVIEARSGLRAYNFAVAGGQAPGSYFLLKRALESGARPKAVVVDYFPRLLTENARFNLQNWPFVAGPVDAAELAWTAHDWSLLADLLLREALPSVRCRHSIRDAIGLALGGTRATFTNEIQRARRNWEVNRGAEIVVEKPGQVDDVEAWIRGYFPKFHCSRINQAYIDRFMDLAAEHSIPVFWVLPPYKPALQARVEQTGFDARHEAFLRSMMDRHPNLSVIDSRGAGFDPDLFTDPHHLGRQGASNYSAHVADVLRQSQDDPRSLSRWVRLPEYRPMAMLVPLEDCEQSRARTLELGARKPNGLLR